MLSENYINKGKWVNGGWWKQREGKGRGGERERLQLEKELSQSKERERSLGFLVFGEGGYRPKEKIHLKHYCIHNSLLSNFWVNFSQSVNTESLGHYTEHWNIFDIIKHSLYSMWWELCWNKQFINKSDLMSFQLAAAECLWLTMISWRWDASNLIQQCSLLPKQGSSEAPRGLAIVERPSHQEWAFFFFFFKLTEEIGLHFQHCYQCTHLVTRTLRSKVFCVCGKGNTQEVDWTESF